jgi:hypothetical protein
VSVVDINWLAVLVAAVVSMGIGAFWYSPSGFGKQWTSLLGFSSQKIKDMQKGASKSYAWGFAVALVMAAVLAMFVDFVQATTVAAGVQVGLWVWLGFIATTTAGSVLWEGKPLKLYVLNNGYHIVSLAVMGAILAAWS